MHELVSYIFGGLVVAALIVAASAGFFGPTFLEPVLDWLARATGLQARSGIAGESVTGVEGLLGETAEVIGAASGSIPARVRIRGESWIAISTETGVVLDLGQRVKIVRIEGLNLFVTTALDQA